MAKVTILKMQRYPDGGGACVYTYQKTLIVTETKETGFPPLPEGWTQEQHEAEFFRTLQEAVEADTRGEHAYDVPEVDGRTVEDLLRDAPAPPAPAKEPGAPAAAAAPPARSTAVRKKLATRRKK